METILHHPGFKIKVSVLLGVISLLMASPANAQITNPVLPTLGSGDPGGALATIIANLWKSGVIIGGILFILYFVWGAISWLTAGGDKARLEEARQKISNALIGLVILAASLAIIELLGGLLNIPFLETLSFTFPTP
ncbi:hypothetical protein IH980_02710 [Patescibacteria group bacterium]|nr:hypothetical protein [Patescibacteria group bacterium]